MVALEVDGDVEFEGGPRMTDMTDNPLAAKPPRAATVVPELSATSSSSRDSCCASWWALHGKVWGSAIILLGAYQFLYLALLFLLHCTEFVRGIATYVYDAFNHSWGKQRLLLDAYMGVTLGQKIFVGIFTTAGMAVIASLPFTVRRSWIHQQQRKRQECSSPGSTSGGKVLPQKRPTAGRCRRCISGVIRVQQWVSEYLSPGSAFFAYNSFVLEIIEQTFQFINLDEFGRLGRPLYLLIILTFVMLANAVASWWLTRRRTFRETYALTVFEATTDTFYGTIPLVVLLVDIVYVLNGWGRFAVLKEGGEAGEAAASYEAGSDAVLVLSQDLRVALLGGSASELTIKIFTKCWPLISGIIRLRDLVALDPHHSLHILAADGDYSSKQQAALIVGLNGRQPTMVRIASEIGQLSSSLLVLKLWGVSINRVSPLDRGRAPPLSVPSELGLLSRLLQLDLTGQGLPTIPRQLEQLSNLIILDNALTEISLNQFESLSNLRGLHLQKNKIASLAPDQFATLELFDNVPDLLTLDLHLNSITSLGAEAFSRNLRLTTLLLNNNALTYLPPRLLPNHSRLEELRINDNQITAVPLGFFANATGIRVLWMGNNPLQEMLDVDTFQSLGQLDTLRLENAGYGVPKTLPWRFVRNNPLLTFLHLKGNNLESIKSGAFEKNRKMRSLFLNFNKLQALPNGLLNNIEGRLQNLLLNNNRITALQPGLMRFNTKLTNLNVNSNRVAALPLSKIRGLPSNDCALGPRA
eukprot:g4812.t1